MMGVSRFPGELSRNDMARELTVLTKTVSTEWSGDGFRIHTLRARYQPASWCVSHESPTWAFVLARRGAFRRQADGLEYVVDANTGFVRRPGEVWRTAIFTTALEELTIVELEPTALAHLPDLGSSVGPFAVDPPKALAHRLLVHDLRSDDLDIEIDVLDLVHECLAEPGRYRPSRVHGSTAAAHRQLVADCVELLHSSFHEQLGLLDLARRVGASPYHLSRLFHEVIGITIAQYRTRLRVNAVLERLDAGDDDLAAVAATTGFADHSHMTRTLNGQLGARPSDIRTRLRADRSVIGRLADPTA
jgi:AraC-like DNA-binding protein